MMHQIRPIAHAQEPSAAALYHAHARMILAYVRPRVKTKEDAEDLLVEVFLAALQNGTPIPLNHQEQLTWLRHIARNKIIDRYRRQGRLPAISSLHELTETLLDDEEQTPEALILRDSTYEQLRASLAGLPPLQQEVLRLRFVEDLRTRDIAIRLAKSDSAIRMILSRTLKHLRTIYEDQQGKEVHNGISR
jgi:RNA polymerase sigma factor (sigma-70 family)